MAPRKKVPLQHRRGRSPAAESSSTNTKDFRRTIAVDFDGVIAEYDGWKGCPRTTAEGCCGGAARAPYGRLEDRRSHNPRRARGRPVSHRTWNSPPRDQPQL